MVEVMSPASLSSEVASRTSAHVTSFLQWALCLESGRGLNVLQARSAVAQGMPVLQKEVRISDFPVAGPQARLASLASSSPFAKSKNSCPNTEHSCCLVSYAQADSIWRGACSAPPARRWVWVPDSECKSSVCLPQTQGRNDLRPGYQGMFL